MKALEILKEYKNNIPNGHTYDLRLDEAIAELEEAMKSKTCRGCKQSWEPNNQTFHRYYCNFLKIPVHGHFCCNRYEPEDKA